MENSLVFYASNGKEPKASEIAAESRKYLEFGIRPVWFDKFDELPGLIRRLQAIML